MILEEVESRLKELYHELYNKPKNFWGVKFTVDEAQAHYKETKELEREYYRLTGQYYRYQKEDPPVNFQKEMFLKKNYPHGVWSGR